MRSRPHMLALIALVAALSLAASVAAAQATQPSKSPDAAATTGVGGAAVSGEGLINRAGSGSASASSPNKSTSIANSAARVAGSLAVVLGLMILTYWTARRLLPQSSLAGAAGGGGGAVVVLARTHLSARQKILIVQVGRRVLVVGDGGGGQLNTLCEIDDADEAAALIGQIHSGGQRDRVGGRSFASLFGAAKDRMRSTTAAAEGATIAQSDLANFDGPADVSPEEEEVESARRKLDGLMRQVRGLTRQIDRT